MPSGLVMYLMPRSTAAPMLLLPSSTEGMYALLMAPGRDSLPATVKYTIPDQTQGHHQTRPSDLRCVITACISLNATYCIQCCCGPSRSPEPWCAPVLGGSRGRPPSAGWTAGYECSLVEAAVGSLLRETHSYTLYCLRHSSKYLSKRRNRYNISLSYDSLLYGSHQVILFKIWAHKKFVLTRSLTHLAVAHFPVAGCTLTVIAALGVLTHLRTGAVHFALIDVWRSEERVWETVQVFHNFTHQNSNWNDFFVCV